MTRPAVLVVTGRGRLHELAFLALSVVFGAGFLLGAPPPTSVAAKMAPWQVHLWAAGLLVSGLIGWVSVALRRKLPSQLARALWLEMAAMLAGAAALVFAIVDIIVVNGAKGFFGWGMAAVWALANIGRAGQIYRDLGKIGNGG